LGTACEGLTTALSKQGVEIQFVVPEVLGGESADHMRLTQASFSDTKTRSSSAFNSGSQGEQAKVSAGDERYRVASFLKPYWNQRDYQRAIDALKVGQNPARPANSDLRPLEQALADGEVYGVELATAFPAPAKDLFSEVERFTLQVVSRFSSAADFDIIHAHDWMTFPAAVALSKATGSPLVAHIHSLEHDRSGLFYDRTINSIERFGLTSAARIVAVSHYTQRAIERYHAIPSRAIEVVHNGIYPRQTENEYRRLKTWPKHIVLFLGRVTFQKGPDYFVEVAAKVIPKMSDVLFVLAGAGDMLPELKQRVRDLKLEAHFLFPGFVRGEELEELFSVADLYVMPSVSEPFGLAALEAISFDTPVIVSKQSGVTEVIKSALTVDFWDTDTMSEQILSVLSDPDKRAIMVASAKQELELLHWDAAASKTIEIYRSLLDRPGGEEFKSALG
jgi:glycosyltransferase involved in cell wall biosynthesis